MVTRARLTANALAHKRQKSGRKQKSFYGVF
jgi:hypothetical protein